MTFSTAQGATSIHDLSDLIIPLTAQAELDAAEFDNIHKAELLYFRSKKFKNASWFTPANLQKIHKEMFDEVWQWAGKYRKHAVMPVGAESYKIPVLIHELCQDVAFWLTLSPPIPLLEMSARIHQRLAWIHPFHNGNGRFSRFVSNLFLFSYRHPLPVWPSLSKEGNYRQIYLKALREADLGHFQPLINYLQELQK
jgi:Fic-DOC domain mobile mystery protein B